MQSHRHWQIGKVHELETAAVVPAMAHDCIFIIFALQIYQVVPPDRVVVELKSTEEAQRSHTSH